MHNNSSSPFNFHKISTHSPQKLSGSVNLVERYKSRLKNSQLSPSNHMHNAYTVHHEQKLKVYVKFKPASLPQQFLNVTYINQKQVEIERQSTHNKIYSYDYVFNQNVSSEEVFNKGCLDVIDEMLAQGQNGLIFVYGHTGTGKTYTMGLLNSIGETSKGIVPQSLRYIFKIKDKSEQKTNKNALMQISLSFNQIYMDQVYDMLDFESERKLQIRQNQTNKEPYIQNNISIIVNTIQQAYQLLNIGLEKRRVGEQKINKRSSRGHGLITLNIALKGGKVSRLCFVDLAGSERVKESESVGKTLKQAVHINTSLSALEALLMNIDEQSVRMYRGNKLTRLLQPFLQSGKIRLFVTSNYENIQPLQFAKRCKGIKFMEKQIQYSNIHTSPMNNRGSKSPLRQMGQRQLRGLQKQVQKLQLQNKLLTQLVTNIIVMLNKINKVVINLIDEQKTHSMFSLSSDYEFSMLNRQVEDKINQKINQLQVSEEEIILKSHLLRNSKQKDDSANTSVTNSKFANMQLPSNNKINNGGNAENNEIQTLLNLLPNQAQKLIPKVNEIGFNIFQYVKILSNLCQYRNIYKRQIFTYGIKQDLLQNKNHQLEKAVNCLLKHTKNYDSNGIFNKALKQLKQLGIQLTGGQKSNLIKNNRNISQNSQTPRIKNTSNMQLAQKVIDNNSNGREMSKLTNNNDNNHDYFQQGDECVDEQLFNNYQNVNKTNKVENEHKNIKNTNMNKNKPPIPTAGINGSNNNNYKGKTITKKQSTNAFQNTPSKSTKKIGGLILIQDL